MGKYLQVFAVWTLVKLGINNVTLGILLLGSGVLGLSSTDAAVCAPRRPRCPTWLHPRCLDRNKGPSFRHPDHGLGLLCSGLVSQQAHCCAEHHVMLGLRPPRGQHWRTSRFGPSPSTRSMSVGVSLITWLVTTFGISVFHDYERSVWVPHLAVYSIFFDVAANCFDLETLIQGNHGTVVGNCESILFSCVSAAITYPGLRAGLFLLLAPFDLASLELYHDYTGSGNCPLHLSLSESV